MLRGHLGDLLVHRNRVAFRWPNLSPGEPNVDAVVMMAEAAWMMQPADGRDHIAMFLQRLERSGELIILAGGRDLVVQRVNSVGEINEGRSARRLAVGLRGPERNHAFEKRQSDAGTGGTKSVTAVHEPGLGKEVHGCSGVGVMVVAIGIKTRGRDRGCGRND